MKQRWRRKYPRKAHFPGTCSLCNEEFPAGTIIAWAPSRNTDHWRCYMDGVAAKRGPYAVPGTPENIIGVPRRVGLSDRASKDLEALRRAQEHLT